jgi:hypothetical protein
MKITIYGWSTKHKQTRQPGISRTSVAVLTQGSLARLGLITLRSTLEIPI